jgi:hypothetical protein
MKDRSIIHCQKVNTLLKYSNRNKVKKYYGKFKYTSITADNSTNTIK